jgi:hypothetical protein
MLTDLQVKEYQNIIKKLNKKNIDLIITDFDDTIFSTKELIEKDYRKWRRWQEWNEYMKNNNLFDIVVNDLYKNKSYPDIISKKLRPNHDLILTAWNEEFQLKKIKAINLDYINIRVVDSGEDKILETIKYIINILQFIPNKITVYEDRPEFFVKNKRLLEKLFWTTFQIILVKMINNDDIPKFQKL